MCVFDKLKQAKKYVEYESGVFLKGLFILQYKY